jgi:UDP-N-acetylenolpyruvoylglucosamine reductase
VQLRHDEPLLMVGLGSNLLVRDGGFDGTAVFTHGALARVCVCDADGCLYAEAGVASPKVARFRRPIMAVTEASNFWPEFQARWVGRWP